MKNMPLSFHKQARKAAKYALAAGEQGKYKEMFKMIFSDYRGLKTNEDLPLQYAIELGLDVEKLKRDMNDPKMEALIKEEENQLRQSGLRASVPKFIIGTDNNGTVTAREPAGKRDVPTFSAIIDDDLAKLKK